MHDFTDDNLPSSDNTIPQDDQRTEFDDFDTFRNVSDDAFRYY